MKISLWYYSLIFLVFHLSNKCYSQVDDNNNSNVSSSTTYLLNSYDTTHILNTYDTSAIEKFANAALIRSSQFNQGSISDVALLIQGKVPGLSIYNRGGDPNKLAFIGIRGINTMASYIPPLFVIDDIVGASIENVDANDIESIQILKDGASTAAYGILGAMGVIKITTKKADSKKAKISYNGQFGHTKSLGNIKLMTADEFIAANGINLGSKTDWIKEITRVGFTNNHSLSFQSRSQQTGFRMSANYRDVQGILLNSGFKQLNFRSNFNASVLKNKLKFDVNVSNTNRKSDLSFTEAFGYALTANPTMPVFGKDAIHPFNSEQYGGYFEPIGLFEGYNPVSILDQNKRYKNRNDFNVGAQAGYQLIPNLSFNLIFSHQKISDDFRSFYPTTAYFGGNASSPNKKGLVDAFDQEDKFNFFEGKVKYKKLVGHNKLAVEGGFFLNQRKFASNAILLANFTKDYEFEEFVNKIDLSKGNKWKTILKTSPDDNIASWFANAKYCIKDFWSFTASFRRDGSTRLGANKKWASFPAVSSSIDLNRIFKSTKVAHLIFQIGFGKTGNLPQQFGLSQQVLKTIINPDSSLSTFVERAANPNLKWEERSETNLGIDFATHRLSTQLDIYTSNSNDFITLSLTNEPKYENKYEIYTKGVELSINYDIVKKLKINYKSGLILSHSNSVLKDYNDKTDLIGAVDVPDYFSSNLILLKEEEEIGTIVGPVFESIHPDGYQIFKDINGDGIINVNKEYSKETDLAILGKGRPSLELGWTNLVDVGRWRINAFFRAAFGHSLVNGMRINYEAMRDIREWYNYVNTNKKLDGLKAPRFSSIHVEKADFLKLDNLSISHSFDLKKISKFGRMVLTLTGQNLFVITDYSGSDPEPALSDNYLTFLNTPSSVFSFYNIGTNSIITPGIDRRKNYLPSRNIVISAMLEF